MRVGIFGIGLAAYWPQFEGLRERLEGYQRDIHARLEAMGAEVVSAGLVDCDRGIISDSKSGVSGAGKEPTARTHFVSVAGARFYGLPLNEGTITLVKEPWTVAAMTGNVVPFRAGETLTWKVQRPS